MFDSEDLRAAVAADVIGADQAARLERWLKARREGPDIAHGESLRFITNLNDIFITVGLGVLLLGAAGAIGLTVVTFVPALASHPRGAGAVVMLPLMVMAWMLAEYFCGRRRLLLPSMGLSLAFVVTAGTFVAALSLPSSQAIAGLGPFDVLPTASRLGYAGLVAATVAAVVFYGRFRLPFSTALIALALSGILYLAAVSNGETALLLSGWVSLLAGLVTLAVAIAFDMRDPDRVTRLSDNAFWLHLVAAPQIILGLRGVLDASGFDPKSTVGASVLIAALLLVGALSVALNRRALILSCLITFTIAIGVILSDAAGGNPGWVLAGTALIVGGGIVLLGGGWKTARRGLLSVLPRGPLWARVFPPEVG